MALSQEPPPTPSSMWSLLVSKKTKMAPPKMLNSRLQNRHGGPPLGTGKSSLDCQITGKYTIGINVYYCLSLCFCNCKCQKSDVSLDGHLGLIPGVFLFSSHSSDRGQLSERRVERHVSPVLRVPPDPVPVSLQRVEGGLHCALLPQRSGPV